MVLSSNSPPEITVKTYSSTDVELQSNWNMAGYLNCPPEEGWGEEFPATLAEQEADIVENGFILPEFIPSDKCLANFAFASVDPDGDTMTKGIDLDLDGLIDIPIVPANGQVVFGMDNSSLYDWPVYLRIGEGIEDARIGNVAFIAIDEHGASTAEIIHFVSHSSLDNDPTLYQFDGTDATSTPSSTGGDDLVRVMMMQGSMEYWILLEVNIVVDGGSIQNCVKASDADVDGLLCTYTLSNNLISWDVGEYITISEGANNDLCDGVCEVVVTLSEETSSSTSIIIGMLTVIAE